MMKVFPVFMGLLAAIMGTVQCILNRKPLCYLNKNYGVCSGHRIMWTFSTFDHKCVTFIYSNCGGNANRFYTKEQCEFICSEYSRDRPLGIPSNY